MTLGLPLVSLLRAISDDTWINIRLDGKSAYRGLKKGYVLRHYHEARSLIVNPRSISLSITTIYDLPERTTGCIRNIEVKRKSK